MPNKNVSTSPEKKKKGKKNKKKKKKKTKKNRLVSLAFIIIGLPVRAMPNQEMRSNILSVVIKGRDKMTEGYHRMLWVSHSHISWADFSGEGSGHFKSSGEQIWKSIGTNTELVRGVIGPISSPNDDLKYIIR